RLRIGEGDQSTFQVDIGPSQAELFGFSQACENGEPNPGVIGLTDRLAQSCLLFDGEKACSSCAYCGELDAGEGTFLNHASPDCPPEYMTKELEIVDDSLRGVVLHCEVGYGLLKECGSHGMQGFPCQTVCPPLPVVPLVGNGRGLL